MLFLRISNKSICVFENKMKKEWCENQFICQPSAAGSSPAASAWPPATQSTDRQSDKRTDLENSIDSCSECIVFCTEATVSAWTIAANCCTSVPEVFFGVEGISHISRSEHFTLFALPPCHFFSTDVHLHGSTAERLGCHRSKNIKRWFPLEAWSQQAPSFREVLEQRGHLAAYDWTVHLSSVTKQRKAAP